MFIIYIYTYIFSIVSVEGRTLYPSNFLLRFPLLAEVLIPIEASQVWNLATLWRLGATGFLHYNICWWETLSTKIQKLHLHPHLMRFGWIWCDLIYWFLMISGYMCALLVSEHLRQIYANLAAQHCVFCQSTREILHSASQSQNSAPLAQVKLPPSTSVSKRTRGGTLLWMSTMWVTKRQ